MAIGKQGEKQSPQKRNEPEAQVFLEEAMSSDGEELREYESHKEQVVNVHDYYTHQGRDQSGSPKIAGKHSHWYNEQNVGSSVEELATEYKQVEQPIDIYIDAISNLN